MKRMILALTALGLSGLSGPRATPAVAGEGACRIYCEVMYIGCLASAGSIAEQLCTEWYEGCKVGCKVERR